MVSAQKDSLPLQVQQCVDDLLEHVARIEANIAEYDRIFVPHGQNRSSQSKADGIEGRRVPTTACALVASIGNAHDFEWTPAGSLAGPYAIAVQQLRKVESWQDNESWRFVSENISGSGAARY